VATIVNMHDAKILIANHGKPIAMLSRIPPDRNKIPWGIFKGTVEGFEDYM